MDGHPKAGLSRMDEQIRCEHVRTFYGDSVAATGAHLVSSALTAALLVTQARRPALALAWLGAIALACAVRAYAIYRYNRTPAGRAHWRTWERIGVAFAGLFGCLWGAAILIFFDIRDPESLVLMTVVPIGLASAATATNAAIPAAYYAFEAQIATALIAVMIASGTALGYTVSGLVLATALFRIAICRRLHATVDGALRLGYENLALRTEAERANAAKTRFLAAASHDLRQPIHALGLSFSALSEMVRGHETAPLVAQVDACIDAIRQMLEALLDISKLDAGVVQAQPSDIELCALLRRLETELVPLARQGGNRLRVRTARIPLVRSDAAMLECILRNLIGNALRYTQDGKVLVTARRRGDATRIAVRDTGIGIPEDQLDEIFLEFRQLSNPARARGKGLGLGLAIVQRLTKLLGHPLGVRSRLGQGSCFWIDVPRARGPAAAPGTAATAQRTPARPVPAATRADATVLVLDDDGAVREAMAALLPTWGYRVLTVGTVAEALALAAREPFDLLVADYRLPGDLSCAEAIDTLQRRRGRAVPVLVITGDTAPERLQEAQSLGLPLLHKPVQPARLRAALRNLAARDAAAAAQSG